MVFPKAVYDEIKSNWAGHLIDENSGDIKVSYANNIMTSITQEAWQEQGERIKFQASVYVCVRLRPDRLQKHKGFL